jgi:hypothetical protein
LNKEWLAVTLPYKPISFGNELVSKAYLNLLILYAIQDASCYNSQDELRDMCLLM